MARKPSDVQLRIMREMALGARLLRLSNMCVLGAETVVYNVTANAMLDKGLISLRGQEFRLTWDGRAYLAALPRKEGE